MNNAKMTFRFDDQGRQTRQERPRNAVPALDRQYGEQRSDAERGEAEFLYIEPTVGFTDGDHSSETMVTEDNKDPMPSPQLYRALELTEDWGDPFTDYTGTGGTILPSYTTREPRTSWWKVAGSLTGAIVTGALFGFVVLSMFNEEVTVPIPGISVPKQSDAGEAADLPVFGPIGGGMEETVDLPAGITVHVALPEQTYHFLQYGVFSTAEGVQLAQKELQDSGIAAARDTVDEKRVYAGVSPDREQSKLLSSQLKTAGVELILHDITLPSSAQVVFDGDAMLLERYFTQSGELIKLLSSFSASRLSEVSPQALQDDELAELGQKHQLWTESVAAIRGKLPEDVAEEAGEMERAMNSAVKAIAEYNKKGAKTLLWEVQDEVMNFILAEQKWIGPKA